jgi:DNA-binding NarL/FixJ family response regulator
MKPTRILLVDDHAVVRQGFKMILSAQPDSLWAQAGGNASVSIRRVWKDLIFCVLLGTQ